uniref:CSON000744 protein n=1 Tax=Culicoides sonorensis TaxID=179676 RepID=A0A336LV33_CULSO
MIKIKRILLFLTFSLYTIDCNDSYIQINFKKPINQISDKYVSFNIDAKYLLNGYYTRWLSNSTEDIFDTLGPAYIKLNMSPELKFESGATLEQIDEINLKRQIEFGIQEWKNLQKWTEKHNFVAVIQLDYDQSTWKARDTLRLLGVANDIGIKNCVWQLGSEINDTGVHRYIDDFKAFETMIRVFPEEKTNWKVIPANFNQKLGVSEASSVFNELNDISSVNVWQQEFHQTSRRHQNLFSNKDTTLKYLLKQEANLWLSVLNRPQWSSSTDCGTICIQEGLQWAQILGDASRTGFQSVLRTITRKELMKPNYQYFVTRLFKQLIGNTVFSVTGLKGDKTLSHHYAFCSKNQTGGFVLMVVNKAEERLKTEFKLTFRHKKSIAFKYALTVCDGDVCLNDEKITVASDLNPLLKKKNFKRSIILSIPPQSVTFYEFPHANIGQCKVIEDSEEVDESAEDKRVIHKQKRSSVTKFLRDLALENLNHERRNFDVIPSRMKRQLGPKFKEFNLFKQFTPPQPMLSQQKHNHLNNGKILSVHKPEKTKIPGIDALQSSIEDKLFASKENTELPRGEMYLFVGSDTKDKDTDYDYVEFDQNKAKQPVKEKKKEIKTYLKEESEDPDYDQDTGIREKSVEVESIDTFFDNFGGEFVRPAPVKGKVSQPEDREIAEITASKTRSGSYKKHRKQNKNDENTQYAVLVKELAPTVRQNQMNRKQAQKKVEKLGLGDLEVEEPSQDNNQNDFEDYEYFNEDDERFFSSDEDSNSSTEKTKRNSNRIDEADKQDDIRFMQAFENLLRKIGKKVMENTETKSEGTPVRTRRSIDSIDSVLVPKRKIRKSVKTSKIGKQRSKAEPIDIKNIVARTFNHLRKKRDIYNLNDISSAFYEVANEIDEEIKSEPTFYIKQLKHFHIQPSTNDFNISADFVVQPKMIDRTSPTPITIKTTDFEEIEEETQTEFTTTIITPIASTTNNTDIKIATANVLNGFIEPFVNFYHDFVKSSKSLWNSFFVDIE